MIEIILSAICVFVYAIFFVSIIIDDNPSNKQNILTKDEKRAMAINKHLIEHGLPPKPINELVEHLQKSRKEYYEKRKR